MEDKNIIYLIVQKGSKAIIHVHLFLPDGLFNEDTMLVITRAVVMIVKVK